VVFVASSQPHPDLRIGVDQVIAQFRAIAGDHDADRVGVNDVLQDPSAAVGANADAPVQVDAVSDQVQAIRRVDANEIPYTTLE
jgi:hypothetical protein